MHHLKSSVSLSYYLLAGGLAFTLQLNAQPEQVHANAQTRPLNTQTTNINILPNASQPGYPAQNGNLYNLSHFLDTGTTRPVNTLPYASNSTTYVPEENVLPYSTNSSYYYQNGAPGYGYSSSYVNGPGSHHYWGWHGHHHWNHGGWHGGHHGWHGHHGHHGHHGRHGHHGGHHGHHGGHHGHHRHHGGHHGGHHK